MEKLNQQLCLAEQLKKIALENYNNGGDGVIECWDKQDYIDFIQGCEDNNENVFDEFRKSIGIWDSHRKDIEATAF